MIEFYGELANKCKIARAKKISKNNGIIFLIVTIILSIIALIFGIINGVWYYALILIVYFVVTTVIMFVTPKKRILSLKFPTRLVIENDTISTTALGGNTSIKTKSLSKVKKVVDFGEWYDIIFKFGDISNSWVCQKNLIRQGTIEDFESLFQGKIVRK